MYPICQPGENAGAGGLSLSLEARPASGLRVYRPTWAEIDPNSLRHNLEQIRAVLPPRVQILSVVKANAYGHGSCDVSRLLAQWGIDWFGVSSIEEGLALRACGLKGRILLLGTSFPFDGFEAALKADLTPTVASLRGLEALAEVASRLGRHETRIHLKVETGMGRIGVSPAGVAVLFDWLNSHPAVRLEGIYTHFSCADSNPGMTLEQLSLLRRVIEVARQCGQKDFVAHAANSAAVFSCPETHLDMVRPGLSLYGVPPWEESRPKPVLWPVLTWKTRIAFIKSISVGTSVSYGATFRAVRASRIATLPVGYADGYRRDLSNMGQVLIRGQRCPVVGRITMDHAMVDITDLDAGVEVGEEVVLLGSQGKEEISAWDMARSCRTIPYEILCGISQRVPRIMGALE
jgi:alanine racemase